MMTSSTERPSMTTDDQPAAARPARYLRGWAATAGRDVAYLMAVLAWSIVGFGVWIAGLSATVSLLVFVVGVFVWIGFAHVMRWTTSVDRRLAGWLRREPV